MYKIVSLKNTFNFNLIPNTIVDSHEQVLAFWQDALAKGWIQKGATLIHVDAHSDIFMGRNPPLTTKANFINEAIRLGIIKKVIWVVPDGLPEVSGLQSQTRGETNLGIFEAVPYKTKLYSDSWEIRTAESFGWGGVDKRSYSEIELEVVRLSELNCESDNLIFDIDYDFFSNSGHDTHRGFKVDYSDVEVVKKIYMFFSKIMDLNIHPNIITAAKSFDYVNVHQRNILDKAIRGILGQ
ncbi:MAG: UPF0489 family protein [Candidatus Riflemargulisbacteria bacterium]